MNDIAELLRCATIDGAAECLRVLRDNRSSNCTATVVLPKADVQRIYSIRRRITERAGTKVRGYQYLMTNLEETSIELVKVHLIKGKNVNHILFTDKNLDVLLGILSVPRKNSLSGDPL